MSEKFKMLSADDQVSFAKELVEKINSEQLFSEETDFEVQAVNLDSSTDCLCIHAATVKPIKVYREATWWVDTKEDVKKDPGDEVEYESCLVTDVQKSFKTSSCTVNDFGVLLQVDTTEEDKSTEVSLEVCGLNQDGDDFVVDGVIARDCCCTTTFFIKPLQ